MLLASSVGGDEDIPQVRKQGRTLQHHFRARLWCCRWQLQGLQAWSADMLQGIETLNAMSSPSCVCYRGRWRC